MGYLHISNLYHPKAQDILLFNECYALEKIHGCVHADTPILMADGSIKPIKNIKDGDKIKSYNININQYEDDNVDAMFCRPSNSTLAWYKLEFSNGTTIICTGDHPVLTTDGWIQAEKLTENHTII